MCWLLLNTATQYTFNHYIIIVCIFHFYKIKSQLVKKIVYKKCCNTTVLSWLCNLVSNPSEVIVKWCIYRNVSLLYVSFVRLFQQNRDEQRPWQGKILIINGRQAIGQYLNNISLHKSHYFMIFEGKICNNMQKYF